MDGILYIPLAILVLVMIFIVLKLQMNKIARKDLNSQILQKKGLDKDYYFINEKTGKIYMLKPDTGELYYCMQQKDDIPHKKFRQIVVDLKYSTSKDDYKKLSENYYEIIEKDIYFDINNL